MTYTLWMVPFLWPHQGRPQYRSQQEQPHQHDEDINPGYARRFSVQTHLHVCLWLRFYQKRSEIGNGFGARLLRPPKRWHVFCWINILMTQKCYCLIRAIKEIVRITAGGSPAHNNKHTVKQLLISVAATVVLAGCASTGTERLAHDTAQAMEEITSDQVAISNVQREGHSVKWVATTPAGIYDCEADETIGFVTVAKRE